MKPLSDKIVLDEEIPRAYLNIEDVKEFIKLDEELINQFACGQITLLELKEEREKIIGDLE